MTHDRWLGLELDTVRTEGDLRRRAEANWKRLSHPAFRAPDIFSNVDAVDWPGDWVARTLHANVLLASLLDHPLDSAKQIVDELPDNLNEQGYFGELIDPDRLTEQQLGSPPGWFLRGLIEYFARTGDERALRHIADVRAAIAVPMTDWWESYPIDPSAREKNVGDMVGLSTWVTDKWHLSSDIGNQFMLLDGLTQLQTFDPTKEVDASIRRGISRFAELDLEKVNVQTHATLTTLRGILRFYRQTGEREFLDIVSARYALYRSRGMTAGYANINWFGRPETWTEPCAIVDSFILAVELWRESDDWRYLRDAHLIWFNAIGRGQRGNGGFGCDSCVGFDSPWVEMNTFYEAFFCCTQRGAEGHAAAASALYHTKDAVLAVTLMADSTANVTLGESVVRLRQTTQYPFDMRTTIQVEESDLDREVTIKVFVADWADATVAVNGTPANTRLVDGFVEFESRLEAGDRIDVWGSLQTWRGDLPPWTELVGYHTYHMGPILLAHRGSEEVTLPADFAVDHLGDGVFEVVGTGLHLYAPNDAVEHAPSFEVMRNRGESDYLAWSPNLIAEVAGLPRQLAFATA